MGTATTAPLVAAVSNAGGFGTLGTSAFNAATLDTEIAPFVSEPTNHSASIICCFKSRRTCSLSLYALNRRSPPLRGREKTRTCATIFSAPTMSAAKVMYMAGEVPEARRAAEAGADVLVAQGTEAGGHVVWMASLPLLPMMVNAVAPLPVLCAGGIADGRGLAAALALGAEGVLLGTRFMATPEAPIHPNFKKPSLKATATTPC